MIRSTGKLQAVAARDLLFDAQDTPRSGVFDDTYYSRDGGPAETRHVFLAGNDLPARMAKSTAGQLTVAELGFGTGLNFLSTWALLRECAPAELHLHYWSIDAHPLRRSDLERALSPWFSLAPLARELVDACPPPVAGVHRRLFDGGRVVLDCVWADAADALEDLASYRRGSVDAWFLDGFAPARNADMWREALFRFMAQCSRPGATLASYTAAGAVRRGLEDAGFRVSKYPGFGSKRESIRGELSAPPAAATAALTPWDLADNPAQETPATALVLGAGLAGAHTAAALTRRGIRVSVLDAGAVAGRASGNAQGVLFTRLSHQRSALSDFSVLAHGFAAQLYRQLFARGLLVPGTDGDLGGCFQTPGPRGNFTALCSALEELPELAIALSADEAQLRLGTRPAAGGIWQDTAGWLSPPAVCRALLTGGRISVHEHCGALQLERAAGSWLARDPEGRVLAEAEVAIVATGIDSGALPGNCYAAPLKPVRGQTTLLPAATLPRLEASFCHDGYIAPAVGGEHCIGSSFAPGDSGRDLRTTDHADNVARLAAALPDWSERLEALEMSELQGRAELRAATPDYLPLVGPVPDEELLVERFAALKSDARQVIDTTAPCLPGCYLSAGYGSRGLSYAALGAELLASHICGEISPVSRELQRALSPARFPIRALVRGAQPGRAA